MILSILEFFCRDYIFHLDISSLDIFCSLDISDMYFIECMSNVFFNFRGKMQIMFFKVNQFIEFKN